MRYETRPCLVYKKAISQASVLWLSNKDLGLHKKVIDSKVKEAKIKRIIIQRKD